jgi:hypothetical protein
MSARAIATAVAVAAILTGAAVVVQLAKADEPLSSRLGTTPVIVELFTSQGCSSCPPADELITVLSHDESLRGKVIPIAFHVDYWDHLGWRDPFSSRSWTQRQMSYVRQLRVNGAYTPQAIVSGRKELVGSKAASLANAIVEASHAQPFGTIALKAKREGNSIIADVHGAGGPSSDIIVALVQYDIPTPVKAGENQGRTIVNDAIVRSLQQVRPGRVRLNADASWQHLAVVAFLQDRESLAITNAAVTRL